VFTFDSSAFAWTALAIVAAIVEVSIPHFGVIFVSAGAVGAAVVAAIGLGIPVQVVVFAVVLALSLMLLRPRIVARLSTGPGVPSRTEALIGHDGVVTHDIESTIGAGRVNVGGQDWAARSTTPLAAGTRVRVVGADGLVLEVIPA
jgi:membrane protein implicated in regulation of membrane protease activity